MADSEKLFTDMLREAGVPVTENDMKSRWDSLNAEQGSQIQNDSNWSPFWRLISSLVTEPCKQLVKLLVHTALPNIFLQYAGGQWLDLYAWGVDVERKAAVAAAGMLTITRTNSTGQLFIPAGTIVESPTINGYVYRLASTEDLTVEDGSLVADLPVRAEQKGTAYNLGPGYYSIFPDPVSGVASVVNGQDWLTTPGADEEQDEELRLRARNQFSAVGQYHHDAAYKADIAEFAGIRTDYLYFEHDAPRGPGSANCYVMIESGVPGQDFIDQINAHVQLSGNHGHGDSMICFPIPVAGIALDVIVHPAPHLSDERAEAMRQGVEDMVRCAFRENTDYTVTKTWPLSRFSFSRLGDELHSQFPNLASVEFGRTDIVSPLSLPVLASLTVTLGAA